MRTWVVWGLYLSLVTTVWATPISKLVIFGDSLSDSGNSYEYSQHHMPAAPWYYQGRFSNGPIWTDFLLDAFFPQNKTQHILSYAFGGAGILKTQGESFTLTQEIDSYLLSHSASTVQHSVFFIWIGANDYLIEPHSNNTKIPQLVNTVQKNIERLLNQGAKHFMIISLPDLGLSPFARDLEITTELSQLTQQHNRLLKDMVMKLKERYPHVDWIYFDVNLLWLELMHHPKKYALLYSKEACIQTFSETHKGIDNRCSEYVFFDQFHPTTSVHQRLAEHMMIGLDSLHIQAMSSQ